MASSDKPVVVMAGATGFVGRALVPLLTDRFRVIGLTRGRAKGEDFRTCDLFSLRDAEEALGGADYAFYLVHSMLPSSRLTQGDFEDLDLICADNFGRAAKKAGVKQIVYLGGLLPHGVTLSPHLRSRLEVEHALGAAGVPVTVLRAGLVVGPGGSSLELMVRLVQRLPVMVTPRWTASLCQPIALPDVATLLAFVLGRPSAFGQVYDVGGPDVLSYRALMDETASALGLKRRMFPVPLISPRLSRLWVSTITRAPAELVAPLIESLAHPMVARDHRLADEAGLKPISFRQSLEDALKAPPADKPVAYQRSPEERRAPQVRSVQRLVLPPGRDARWVADEYMRWLPGGARPLRVEIDGAERCHFYLRGIGRPLLILSSAKERSSSDRQLFYVTGGLLAGPSARGRLEFRETPDGKSVISAVHEFTPSLPWPIYRYTQALVHLWVMHAFGRHLARLARRSPELTTALQS
jgi:uncharacterized protein YbjT (DUF2867 family)